MATPGQRCPLSEWRKITLTVGEIIDEATLAANEHWLVMKGKILLGVDNLEIELSTQDVALLRAGTTRCLHAVEDACVIVAREH